MKKSITLSVLVIICVGAFSLLSPAADELERGFLHPPDRAKPQLYWVWANGNISKEGITADLEAMKHVGIGGALIMEANYFMPAGPVKYMSKEWFEMIRHTMAEANRLGLEIYLTNGPGWSNSGGFWIKPEEGMQVVVTSEQKLTGPSRFSGVVPRPRANLNHYRDVALLAFPTPRGETTQMRELHPKIFVNGAEVDADKLMDGQLRTRIEVASKAANQKYELLIEFEKPYSARTLFLACDAPGHQLCEVQVSDDGRNFKSVRTIIVSDWREGMQLAITDGAAPVSARFYRVLLPCKPSLYLAEVNLSDRLSVEQFAAKSAQFRPLGYNAPAQFTVAGDSVAASAGQTAPGYVVPRDRVVDLTGHLTSEGHLDWEVPPGEWTLLRVGHTAAGCHNHVGPDGADGLECDKLSKPAAEAQWAGLMQKVLNEIGPLAGKSLVGVHMDSWEVGFQNWTAKFPEEFQRRRGYDLRPFLPVLSNRVLESPEVSERFLWDLRRTIGELFTENHYQQFTRMAHRNGIKFQGQAYGDGPIDDLPSSGAADIPMGHFYEHDYGPDGCPANKLQSSAAHLYGRSIVSVEAYSNIAETWKHYPIQLKQIGDTSFCRGMNRFVFCGALHQPWTNVAPGMVMNVFGFNFERNITVWQQSAAWLSYLARCQSLLQEGRFVADVCIFANENYLAGIAIPPKPPLPAGYDYDLLDRSSLLERMKFEDGNFTLPSGMRYRYLVLPDSKALTLPVVKKIRDLVAAGGTVIGRKPQFSPTLQDYPACESEIRRIADEVWGQCDGKTVTENRFGKGRVIWGQSYAEVFSAAKLAPDFGFKSSSKKDTFNFIHRTSKNADWYFVANYMKNPVEAICAFRVTGKQPEFWYPDSGKIEKAGDYWIENGQTFVPMRFDPCGSVFVVFREKAEGNGRKVEIKPVVESKPLMEIQGPWQVTFDSKWFYPDNGKGGKVRFDQLSDWSKHPEDAVKYFSGTAVYEKEFEGPPSGGNGRLYLDLGRVEVIAEVELNGKNLGVLWKPPFRADVTGALKPGKNRLVVKVTNFWPNRLIGDEHLPADCEYRPNGAIKEWPEWFTQKKPRTTGRRTFATWRYYKAENPLLPSGLLGPVRLVWLE